MKLLAQLPGVVTSFVVMVSAPAQLSVALIRALLATGTSAAQLTVLFNEPGRLVITGAIVSTTVIVAVQVGA